MSKENSFWRPPNGINSKDYLMAMENPNPLKPPYPLLAHTLGSVSQNLTDALMFNTVELINGKIKTKSRISRPAEETSRDYTLGFPYGALNTPALNLARHGGCETDFYIQYLCPINVCYEHFYVFVDAQMDEPVEAEDLVTVDDAVQIYETTTMHVVERDLYLHLDGYIVNTLDLSTGAGTLQAIHAAAECCPDCGGCVNRILVGGNDGAAASETSYLAISTDRGATFTEIDLDTLTGGDTASMIVTSINSDCDYLWVAFTDDLTTPTAGGVAYSTDGGATWTVPAAVTNGMFATFKLNDVYYVAGADGEIWKAEDGVNWEQVTNNVTTETLLAAAVDEEESTAYIVGENGAAVAYDGSAVVDISAPLAALAVPPGDLYAVHVLERNRIQVSGASGFIAESSDGAVSWTAITVAGTTDTVFALQGTGHRAIAAAGGVLYKRDILSNLKYAVISYQYSPTLTGDVVELSAGEDHNVYWGVMTTGEVIKIFPCHPDYCADRV